MFFFNDTATTEIYTLSLHDALPIYVLAGCHRERAHGAQGGHRARGTGPALTALAVAEEGADEGRGGGNLHSAAQDRKSTRLNSSHANISYAVFCLKKKNTTLIATKS